MDFQLKNKTAFVTGASRGIGAATAKLLAQEGCDVFIGYHTRFDEAEQVAIEIRNLKRKAWLVRMDMSDTNDVQVGVNEILKTVPGIDILVLNAGFNIITPFADLENKEWDKIIQVNLNGPFYVTNALKNHVNKHGAIVFVSSVAGHAGVAHHAHYGAAKAGMINLSRSLSKAMAPDVRVNCIAPGLTKTEMGNDTMNYLPDGYLEHNLLARRAAIPIEIARAVVFLASPVSSFIYGETLNINGGKDFR